MSLNFGEAKKMRTGVAIDLGTSGFRAQKIDLESGKIKKTVITLRNPPAWSKRNGSP